MPMFRPMRRMKQQLTPEECAALLCAQPRGVLSLLGEDGYPYGLPISYWYDPEGGSIYFHGSAQGHKIDALKACDKASFCVYDSGYRKEGEWALNIKSVIVFGRVRPVTDPARLPEILRRLSRKFTEDEAYIEAEIAAHTHHVLCLELVPEHITGKLVNES